MNRIGFKEMLPVDLERHLAEQPTVTYILLSNLVYMQETSGLKEAQDEYREMHPAAPHIHRKYCLLLVTRTRAVLGSSPDPVEDAGACTSLSRFLLSFMCTNMPCF